VLCLAPRVRREIVGPWRLSGVVVRPLNFTARRQAGGCHQTYKSHDESGSYRVTRVFARVNGRWRIVAGKETRFARQNSWRRCPGGVVESNSEEPRQ